MSAFVPRMAAPGGQTRIVDASPGRYLSDLTRVGPQKPLGYLPITTITELCRVELPPLERHLRGRGMVTVQFVEEVCDVPGGTLYAYRPLSLQALLNRHEDALLDAGWPNLVEGYVEQVARVPAPTAELRDLIALSFGNTNTGPFRPRRDSDSTKI